jgi:hypothetical protein
MCYNCGCGTPDDDHGKGHMGVDANGKAVTSRSFAAAGQAFGQDEQTSKKNTHDLLMKEENE